jgi:hypothetical protein
MKWFRRYWPHVVLLLLLSVNTIAILQRQAIGDWLRLRDYQPSSQVVALANDATMTDYAKRLFYVNHPQLEDKQSFNEHCADRDEQTAVLGCYHGNRLGIFVYAVTDERLNGVQQVTAAHEMLHQAYDRLGGSERERINKLLTDYYTDGLTEDDAKEKVESYRRQQNVDLANEMHSIFATEVRDLPDELETYYQRFFGDRLKIVTYSEAYQGEFSRRKALVEQYDQQLKELKTNIDTNKANLEVRLRNLRAKEAEINDALARQDTTSYRAAVTAYNAQVEAYNAKIVTTRGYIDDYNAIVALRNDIAVEEQQLQQALDSRLETAETQ